jgi:hypothetical protein
MSLQNWKRHFAIFGLVAASSIALTGCGQSADQAATSTPTTEVATTVDDHSGWWCVEHGVPEEECAQCDPTLVAKFKEAGDWCEEHNRPESQCFLCSPARFDKFAARYEAKYGKQPPKPTE